MPATSAIALPPAVARSAGSLEDFFRMRRSCREFASAPLSFEEIGQLLWAGQGVTGLGGLRTTPSAGAIFPLRTYLIAARVNGLRAGLYRYDPDGHALLLASRGDLRRKMADAALGQECITTAAAVILLAASLRRMIREFGERAPRLSHTEAGHVGQNVCLQSAAMGLGALTMGAFDEERMRSAVGLPDVETPIYMIALGRKYDHPPRAG